MATEQKIDINRMVRFVDENGEIWPAIVTKVQTDKATVSLFVMKEHTSHHILDVENRENKTRISWHWPPRSA